MVDLGPTTHRYSDMTEYVDALVNFELHNGCRMSPAQVAVSVVVVFQAGGGFRERLRNAWRVLRG